MLLFTALVEVTKSERERDMYRYTCKNLPGLVLSELIFLGTVSTVITFSKTFEIECGTDFLLTLKKKTLQRISRHEIFLMAAVL